MLENGDKKWMVQVALAANQANADAVVSKLRAKGYKVTTSPTSKGIRIMVGPAKTVILQMQLVRKLPLTPV